MIRKFFSSVLKGPKTPFLSVDAIVIKQENEKRQILLISRKNKPLGYALPGGFVDYGESCESAVLRELKEETSLDGRDVNLIGVFSDPKRDERMHVVSVVYEVIVDDFSTLKAADDAKSVGFFELDSVIQNNQPHLAFDHFQILSQFHRRKTHKLNL